MENIENLITDEELVNLSVCSYYNVEEGTYKILFDKYDICYLFDNDDLIYELNDTKSYSILKKIKELNLNSKTINISEHNYFDYNVKLICKINIDIKEIFIQSSNEKLIFIDKINITLNLKPSSEYIITNFEKSKYSGIITTSNGQKYYICRRLLDILQRYFKCKNNKITCVYNNKEEVPKLTLITNQWDEFKNIQGEYIPILRQRLKMEIGEKKFSFYVNSFDRINYNKEHSYYFSTIYVYNYCIYGYEYQEDKYYNLTSKKLIIADNLDKELDRKITNMEVIDEYAYLKSNGEDRGLVLIIEHESDGTYRDKLIGGNLSKAFETTLNILLLQDNKPKIIYNDDIIIDFD